ncbi:alpha/beta hydrolase [Pseudarthrobacter sp. NamB4]|nr:alpha/beta hydrolase [Pseudarthrobacter sp. NamB4]
MWNSLRHSLEPRCRLVVPHLPGHGQSCSEAYISHPMTARALHDLVMQRVGRPVAVIGLSPGAQLAIALAAQHPSAVSRVMVVSPQAKPMAFESLTLGLLGISAPTFCCESDEEGGLNWRN